MFRVLIEEELFACAGTVTVSISLHLSSLSLFLSYCVVNLSPSLSLLLFVVLSTNAFRLYGLLQEVSKIQPLFPSHTRFGRSTLTHINTHTMSEHHCTHSSICTAEVPSHPSCPTTYMLKVLCLQGAGKLGCDILQELPVTDIHMQTHTHTHTDIFFCLAKL